MATYRDVTFASGASDEAHCEIVTMRVRLLGMLIDLGDDETRTPDKMTAFYEAGDGGIIVYDVEQTEDRIRARLHRYGSLEEVRRSGVYSAYLERLEL